MKRELKIWEKDLDWVYTEAFYTDKEYIRCIADIFKNPVFQSMEKFTQHGSTSCRSHCIQVSYLSYNLAKMFGLDYVACARAGLLHDLFLYDWHQHKALTGDRFHGLTHPKTALLNAKDHFELNPKEADIILRHMWPLTVIPPKSVEGFIVSYADKYCSVAEVFLRLRQRINGSSAA
jgi:uncharacterized protein